MKSLIGCLMLAAILGLSSNNALAETYGTVTETRVQESADDPVEGTFTGITFTETVGSVTFTVQPWGSPTGTTLLWSNPSNWDDPLIYYKHVVVVTDYLGNPFTYIFGDNLQREAEWENLLSLGPTETTITGPVPIPVSFPGDGIVDVQFGTQAKYNVNINNGHSFLLDQNVTLESLTTEMGTSLTFDGARTLTVNNNFVNDGRITTASGSVVNTSTALINNGIFEVRGIIALDSGATNNGTLRADGGTLLLTKTAPVTNSGSLFVEGAGSVLQLGEGPSELTDQQSGTVHIAGAGSVRIGSGGLLDLYGGQHGTYLNEVHAQIDNDVVIEAGGRLQSRVFFNSYDTPAHEIYGNVANAGVVDVYHALTIHGTVNNDGEMNVRVPPVLGGNHDWLALEAGATNTGIITVESGRRLIVNSDLDTSGEVFVASDAKVEGAGLLQNQGVVRGLGLLSVDLANMAGGVVEATGSGTLTLNGMNVTNAGTFRAGVSSTLKLTSPVMSSGTAGAADGGTLLLTKTAPVTNSGSLFVEGAGSVLQLGEGPSELTDQQSGTVHIAGAGSVRIGSGGLLDLYGGQHGTYLNEVHAQIDNDVVIEAGGRLQSRVFFNSYDTPAHEIYGNVANAGVVDVYHALTIHGTVNNDGEMNVRVPPVLGGNHDWLALEAGATNTGIITVESGRRLIFAGRFINRGVLNISGSLEYEAIELQGGKIIIPVLSLSDQQNLSGTGVIQGSLANYGLLSPGSSPGAIEIQGDYTQTGTLEIEILNMADFDILDVTGSASLGGTLDVALLDGAFFEVDDTFEFLTAGSIVGTFNDVILPTTDLGDPVFALTYGTDRVTLTALESIPEPTTLGLLVLGSLALIRRRRN